MLHLEGSAPCRNTAPNGVCLKVHFTNIVLHCIAAAVFFYTVEMQGSWVLFCLIYLCTLEVSVGEARINFHTILKLYVVHVFVM
jgi:hypothetical protein